MEPTLKRKSFYKFWPHVLSNKIVYENQNKYPEVSNYYEQRRIWGRQKGKKGLKSAKMLIYSLKFLEKPKMGVGPSGVK